MLIISPMMMIIFLALWHPCHTCLSPVDPLRALCPQYFLLLKERAGALPTDASVLPRGGDSLAPVPGFKQKQQLGFST